VEKFGAGRLRAVLLGVRDARRTLVGSVLALLSLASVAFLLGLPVRLYDFTGWLVLVPVIAVGGGLARAGVVPTVGSLWLVGLWGYSFPPLVGYLTGEWMGAGRYTTPRMLMFAYGSARAELLGGLETSVNAGLLLAVVLGTAGYAVGAGGRRLASYARSS